MMTNSGNEESTLKLTGWEEWGFMEKASDVEWLCLPTLRQRGTAWNSNSNYICIQKTFLKVFLKMSWEG